MSAKSLTNSEGSRSHHVVSSHTPGSHTLSLTGAPTNESSAYPGNSTASRFEIPPPPLTVATVAAPRTGRSAAATSKVLNAEAASRKRKAARSSRDRVSGARASSSSKASRAAVIAKSDDRVANASGDDRSAAARDAGDMAAQQPDCTAVGHEGDRFAVAGDVDCSPVARHAACAASDDVRGHTAAGTESMDAGCRQSRKTYAELALARQNKDAMTKTKPPQASEENSSLNTEALKVPTDPAALLDGGAYVRAVAMHVDLVGASARLVVSTDEKVSKAELDRLRELIFGKGGPPPADEVLRIDWAGIPRPNRERKQFDGE